MALPMFDSAETRDIFFSLPGVNASNYDVTVRGKTSSAAMPGKAPDWFS
ncbi:MAG: hypothetical protein LBP74_01865 [Treponema sp.]|jgi:hypothetical protein|nr:hypothetical protein [Treponema sp.]